MGKLYAIADLHLSYASNQEALAALHDVHHDDGLILVGDMGEKLEHLRVAFAWAKAHFKTVWWVPGNHELYTITSENGDGDGRPRQKQPTEEEKQESRRSGRARGAAKYDLCVATARRHGVLTPEDDFVVWEGGEFADGRDRAVVCPIFTLYDYSFRPADVRREDALDWALAEDIQATDEVLLHPDPHDTRDEWCAALVDRSEAKLARARESTFPGVPLVIANHWPLTEKVVYLPRIPRFSLWCGTRKTADWHTRFGAKVVVSGHLHVRRTDWIDGVRFEECSLGYPRQWEPLAKESGRDINAFLREILPGRGSDPGDGKPIWRTYG
ncbi:metallophosphoesterase [Microdochium nivale]|nr:metallophosphoesterase [Microdochium nivale]